MRACVRALARLPTRALLRLQPRPSSCCFLRCLSRPRRDLLERSHRAAVAEAPRLVAAMRAAGWNTGVVLWTPQHVADWSMANPAPELQCPLPARPPALASETLPDERAASSEVELQRAAMYEGAEDVEVLGAG